MASKRAERLVIDRQEMFDDMAQRAKDILLTDQEWADYSDVAPQTISRLRRSEGALDGAMPSTLWKLKAGLEKAERAIKERVSA